MQRLIRRYEDAYLRGMPDRAIGISNSERMLAACPRKYLFAAIEGLVPERTARPLRFGTAWHSLMERIWKHWRDWDSAFPLSDAYAALEEIGTGLIDPTADDPHAEYVRLTRLFEGYVHTYGLSPMSDWKVVAVEIPVCRPIANPETGRPYRPKTVVAQDADGSWFIPSPMNQGKNRRSVQWPWFQVGRLDAIIQHRETGAVWIWDHKTSASPDVFLMGMTVDPQMPGYLWMLEWQLKQGLLKLPLYPAELKGFAFDVVNSRLQSDPQLLKNGTLSRKKTKAVPSWRYERAVTEHNLSLTDYADHIAEITTTVDPGLYKREFLTVSPEGLGRYDGEIYGEAKRLAHMRRRGAAPSDWSTHGERQRAVDFPRVPICRIPGGYCPYRGPCVADGEYAREPFVVQPSIRWVDTSTQDAEESASTSAGVNIDW